MKCLWLAWLVACGGSNAVPDGSLDSSIDVAIDAPGCAAAQPVTVEGPALAPNATAMLDVTVVAHDSTGAVCGRATGTGAQAQVTIGVPPSGMVTMIVTSDVAPKLRRLTWTLVQPGDHLLFPSAAVRGATAKTVSVTATVAALAGATEYQLHLMCEGGGSQSSTVTPGPVAVDVSCLSTAQHVTATVEASNVTTYSYAVGTVVAIAGSGVTAIPLGAYATASDLTATVHGTTGFDRLVFGWQPFPTMSFGGTTYIAFSNGGDPAVTGVNHVPAAWGGASTIELRKTATLDHTLTLAHVYATPTSPDLTVTSFLPLVDATLGAQFPRPEVTWQTATSIADPDLLVIKVTDWSIVAPGHPGTIRYPELPTDLAPTGTAALLAAGIAESPDVAGYETARLDPLVLASSREVQTSCLGSLLDCAGL